MIRTSSRLLAVVLLAGAVAGCQTDSIDSAFALGNNANGQGDLASRKIAFARKQFAAGNYGLAEKNFRLAVEATPENGEAWLGLAAAYDQLGRFDLSDRAYDRLIKLAGRKPAILNNQGYSYILRGDMDKARRILADAMALAPGNPIIEGNWKLATEG
ncbi:tetratricopeptide repeat protein [Oricola thermophila]|uniref:Tetratricopeptide repeat protein n=1 Tax=Oricola thermophila TaxID=2742145 RepID=A0A6N1VF64_9HYPH|nr:tetratricopeptide repeat protein [Oricola thermophila]QKV17789.1 tetratricopeptide repeat protein [Oricola thermophila]